MLIDDSNRQWDHGFIDGILTPEEAELIKQIPLTQVEVVDSLFWPSTQRGEYTCKSGYRFLKDEAAFELNGIPVDNDKYLWRGICLYTYQTK